MLRPGQPTLPSTQIRTEIDDSCRNYRRKLLQDLGVTDADAGVADTGVHPARRWAQCGLMYLVGDRHNQPRLCPVPLPSCADAALDAFRAIARVDIPPAVRGAQLLGERAAIAAAAQPGRGMEPDACRFLPTRDGVIGVNLPREDDWQLAPAWLQNEGVVDWRTLQERVAQELTATLVARARTLGLAVVDPRPLPDGDAAWLQIPHRSVGATAGRPNRAPRVVDLSSLWAGPLCSHLWQAAGAQVIKVEGSGRPDGARFGPAEFFTLLNRDKQSLQLDLHTRVGQQQLHALLRDADIVLEGSRPRALRQMGIIAEELLDEKPGLTWVSISGYGRREPEANWIAFGDDAGIAAGLSAIMHRVSGDWLVVGDAIADPLTGLHAALAGWASWLAGGGRLLDLSLVGVVRHCIRATAPHDDDYRRRYRQWRQYLRDNRIDPVAPARRGGG